MRKLTMTMGIALLTTFIGACADHQIPASPVSPNDGASFTASSNNDRVVSIFDACDGPTFTQAHIDCSRQSGLTLDQFIADLTAHGSAGAWHFAPSNINVFAGQTLNVINRGGETHTFTEVKKYGGGVVQLLNDLSGNPVPAPECLDPAHANFIPSGGSHQESIDDKGTELYQCCIHPWMRVVVNAK
jgi:plastocyanin